MHRYLSALLWLASTTLAVAQQRPNILFIYVEDLGYYSGERAAREPNAHITGLKTPNLDRLAAQSVNFTRAFCGQITRLREECSAWRKATNDGDVHPKTIPRRATK